MKKFLNANVDAMDIASSNGTGITTATTTELVAATADQSILTYRVFLQNISSTAVLCQLKEEDGTILFEQNLAENQPVIFGFANKFIQLTENKALQLVTSATGDIRWTVGYEKALS